MTDETSSATDLPSSVGRYQITGALGFGAMGAVYKAFDPLIKRTLAIKTIRLDIPRQSPQYASFIERFYREARISGTLSHPNIVTLFDIGEEGGLPFLAMEFVDGSTIASVLEAGTRFKPEKVIGLVSQVALALDYAHSRGVVHRDIKPSNLIVYEDDKVKVTDFGIAKLADSEITHAGVLLGTPSYMSPEQAMGEKLDGRSDIFSLGVCAFEMLSGQQPFPGANVTAILYKLVHVDPIEPPDLEASGLVPQKWHDVFHKVLAKKPEDRYQTAGAFVQDLEYCLGAWFTGLGQETIRIPAEGTPETATIQAITPAANPVPQPATEADAATVMLKPGATGSTKRATAALPQPATEADAATVMLKPGATGSTKGATAALPQPASRGRRRDGHAQAGGDRLHERRHGGPAAACRRGRRRDRRARSLAGGRGSCRRLHGPAPRARRREGCGAGRRGDDAAGFAVDRRRQPDASRGADDARLEPALGAHGCRHRHRGGRFRRWLGALATGSRPGSGGDAATCHDADRTATARDDARERPRGSGFPPRREQPCGRARAREQGAARQHTARPRRASVRIVRGAGRAERVRSADPDRRAQRGAARRADERQSRAARSRSPRLPRSCPTRRAPRSRSTAALRDARRCTPRP